MKVWARVMCVVVLSQVLACGNSVGDGDGNDDDRGNGGSSGANAGGATSGGNAATGGAATTGGTGGATTEHPLCEAFAEEFVMECPQNGTLGDALWLCQEGFDEYTPLGCEAEYADLIVCATEATFDCLTGTVSGCDALGDAVVACSS